MQIRILHDGVLRGEKLMNTVHISGLSSLNLSGKAWLLDAPPLLCQPSSTARFRLTLRRLRTGWEKSPLHVRLFRHCMGKSSNLPQVGSWNSYYTMECLAPVVEATQAVKPPNYQTVLELDRKIREFSMPVSADSIQPDRVPVEMVAFVLTCYRDLSACRGGFTDSY